ncbi:MULTISPECIES: nucleotidyltransferase substrate binding protein [unclassified Clostridium]|uniref:nucleotidyltransferase substrate binding protein n=1 Tax=unclassified Clostridium TaxID=2614128 RepID=UPI00207AD6C2|nr:MULTISPECIES: nucleotidyltransferase substrate binding protein [unclassified Clostridium]
MIDNGHIWIDALSNRKLTTHTYDEELANKMTKEILISYLPELDKMYNRLVEEL